MKLRNLVLVLALLVPSVAMADPITVGIWTPTSTAPNADPTTESVGLLPFWSGDSWDGEKMGVKFLLEDYGVSGLEYLNNGSGNYTSFRFEGDILDLTKIGGVTAWKNGVLGRRSDGAFTYDSGTGRTSNSWDNPGQFALFRDTVTNHYYLGVEDILLSEPQNDRDYNDYIVKFDVQPVPEPATLLLLGSGMAALAARKKLAARKARTDTAV